MKSKVQNIPVITNISVEPFFSQELSGLFREIDISIKVNPIPYMEYQKHGNLYKEAFMIFLWLNLECMMPDCYDGDGELLEEHISDIKLLYQEIVYYISDVSRTKVIVALFEDYSSCLPVITGYGNNMLVDELNGSFPKSLSGNIEFMDLMHIIASVGISNAYSTKNKYRWNYPYSQSLTKAIATEIYKRYLTDRGITKKCVVVDCDNVLWGGILSEDGMESLRLGSSGLGKEYQDFQRFLLALYHRGVILAVCSKNDLSDVLMVFREHKEMILREEHIAYFQVNWDDKPDNIARIAEELGIGLESIVFVDDSPVEIEAVRAILPEVTAIPYHRETVYGQLGCFNLKGRFAKGEYEKRNETYRTNCDRRLLRKRSGSYREYLTSLEMQIDVHEAVLLESARIAELTQRTNRCTNGRRCSVADIQRSVERPDVHLYSVYVKDRYSDLGLVGAMEIADDRLTLFSLSCRALGREVEDVMIAFIKRRHNVVEIEFTATNKNSDLKGLLEKEFVQIKDGNP